MREWQIWWRSAELYGTPAELVLIEVPAWTMVVEWAGEKFLGLTGHVFCCNIPSWAWKVPLGKPKRADDGWLENSLASFIYDLTGKVLMISHRYEKAIAHIDLDDKWLDEHNMSSPWPDDDDEDDADSS